MILDRLRELSAKIDEADAELYLFFQLCPVIMVVADKLYLRRASRYMEKVLGYENGELFTRPCGSFIHPDDLSRTTSVADTKMAEGMPAIKFRQRYLRADGSYLCLCWNASPWTERGLTYAVADHCDGQCE